MGRYLSCGIAERILVDKERYSKDEILDKIKDSIDINIYDTDESEEYVELKLKKDILEKYAIKFIEEQLKIAKINNSKIERLKELENKKYEELMEIAHEKRYINFEFLEGYIGFSNDISYLADGLTITADIIDFLNDGKIIIECYYNLFRYFRNQVIQNSSNPIRTAMVVSLIG